MPEFFKILETSLCSMQLSCIKVINVQDRSKHAKMKNTITKSLDAIIMEVLAGRVRDYSA